MTEVVARDPDDVESGPQPVALVDLLDRLLGNGVVIAGDISVSLAGIELVHVRLHALVSSVRADMVVWP
ncbi:MAG: gas vesicle protein [Actinomycetota bacterium]